MKKRQVCLKLFFNCSGKGSPGQIFREKMLPECLKTDYSIPLTGPPLGYFTDQE
jgi:hypothetical protein